MLAAVSRRVARVPRLLLGGLLGLVGPAMAGTPLEIELVPGPGLVRIDGESVADQTGVRMASCDVNGDGLEDLVIAAPVANGPNGTRPDGGEVYVLYGHKGAWSGPIDLAGASDVHIFGQEVFDDLGLGVACGDLDGDGYADMVLCAYNADSVNDSRNQAGQAHIVFGGSALPSEIDLLTDPGTVIWGAVAGDIMCGSPVVGDLDGDGLADVALDAIHAPDRTGTKFYAGRVHVLFGRTTWPATVDLLTDTDVTIYGKDATDGLGSNMAAGDLDGDGVADLVIDARHGNGLTNTRSDAGDINVFRGRASWPAEIDLATTLPDMLVYGADPGDQAGSNLGLVVDDVDQDGRAELEIGVGLGGGRANDAAYTGEVRRYEPGVDWPPFVDLGTDTTSIIYGADAGDQFGHEVRVGDIDGDGRSDLVLSAQPGFRRGRSDATERSFSRRHRPAGSGGKSSDHGSDGPVAA